MKLIYSGWPGSGTTTLTLLTADLFNLKYYYAGSVLKHFALEIVGADSGDAYVDFEDKFGAAWDKIWEAYAQHKIEHTDDSMLMEGKTAGFLYQADDAFKIFMKATVEARIRRWEMDHRAQAAETIKRRDAEVRERWIEVIGVDTYDEELIKHKFDLVMDTSNMTIEDELYAVLDSVERSKLSPDFDFKEARSKVPTLVKDFWAKGKSHYRQHLLAKHLLVSPQDVFYEWQQMLPQMLSELPREMQTVVNHR